LAIDKKILVWERGRGKEQQLIRQSVTFKEKKEEPLKEMMV